MEKSSKVAIIIGCVLIVLFFIFTRKFIVKIDKTENRLNTSNFIINNEVTSNISNNENPNETVLNEVEENINEDMVEENNIYEEGNNSSTSNNKIKNNTNTQVQGLEEKTSANEEKIVNKKDEALKLVEEEWGKDSTVYYTIDNESGNIYSVSVRSKATTAVLQEYEVDVTKGIVTLK